MMFHKFEYIKDREYYLHFYLCILKVIIHILKLIDIINNTKYTTKILILKM